MTVLCVLQTTEYAVYSYCIRSALGAVSLCCKLSLDSASEHTGLSPQHHSGLSSAAGNTHCKSQCNTLCSLACCGAAAGHSCEHELEVARINNVLGNIDANTGGPCMHGCVAEEACLIICTHAHA
jgi:hypothetical protein